MLFNVSFYNSQLKALVSAKLKQVKPFSMKSQKVERILVRATLRHSNFTKSNEMKGKDLDLDLRSVQVQLCKHHFVVLGLKTHVG